MTAAADGSLGGHDVLDAVLELERSLADPAVRADRDALMRLLHPDFEEVGRSGRHWHRDAIVDALVEEPGDGYALLQERAEPLGPGTILVTYGARDHDATHAASRHSSIWVLDHATWRLRYHQGTPVT
jgi:ribonuclease HI